MAFEKILEYKGKERRTLKIQCIFLKMITFKKKIQYKSLVSLKNISSLSKKETRESYRRTG